MKHLLSLLFSLLAAVCTCTAATYSVSTVPNVHLADSTRFVSNPDGILSANAVAAADSNLQNLMHQTSAEVVCVAVDNIDSDIDDFATNLFRSWGIGKKDKNNGLLLLIVKDQRQVVIRTGTGLEGLLPDGLCGSIIRANIIPNFRKDDYDTGTLGALSDIASILSNPEARQEIQSKYANNSTDSGSDFNLFGFYLTICAVIAAICLVWVLTVMISSTKLTRYQKYLKADSIYSTMLFASFIGLGLPLIAFIPLARWRHQLRRGKHLCPDCGTRMKLVDEKHDNDYLNHAQDIEEKIGAIDYDVWLCPNDGETEIIPYIQKSSAFTECPICHARTMRVVSDRTTVQPTTLHTGTRVVEKRCLNCGFDDNEYFTLPRVVPIVVGGVGGGGRSGGGGGFGGGSFGGGFTAGGGASGRW
ncbi:MAG: TPM domain-containing protein [Bacteroides sp.]|nr:TPM domain-containing protein [Bacteroides sp.]MCM1379830.1 TPM domain-containing protein [Bacteroides sp.]MCM1446189.1 TPM domain-containing protein [Prevotella sp.]